MSRVAYFDLASGASGDMIMGALADAGRHLGVDVEGAVTAAVASLALGCTVTFVDDERGGLACLRAEVKTDRAAHDPARLRRAISEAEAPESARRRALSALEALVSAEAAVHGTDPNDVHLHELGSADTAADLLGSAVGLAALEVSEVAAAPVPLPHGWTRSHHGPLPLPAPATLELLKGALVRGSDADVELVTPSGAAILIAHEASFGPLPELFLQGVGVGGGTRDTERPNICRALVGTRSAPDGPRLEDCVLLETNIDDQTPEAMGYAVESLIEDGALDAWVTPIVMKRSRPAFQLSVLTEPSDEARILDQIFRRTTTLGVRRRQQMRWALERHEMRVRIHGREIRVKVARLGQEVVNVAPEFQDCAALSEQSGIPVKDLYAEAAAAARAQIGELD